MPLGTPIRISIDGPDVTPAFEKCTGSDLLDISIIDSRTKEQADGDEVPGTPEFFKSVELTRKNFNRVRSFQVRSVNPGFIDAVLYSNKELGLNAPVLEELIIAAPEGHSEDESAELGALLLQQLFHTSSSSSAPRLTHLTFGAPDGVQDPKSSPILKNITHLTIDRGYYFGMDLEAFVALVTAVAPNLQEFVYMGYDVYSYQGPGDDRIAAPNLKNLRMVAPSSGFELVRVLDMPKLEGLWLTDERPEQFQEEWVDGEGGDDASTKILMSADLQSIRAQCPLLKRVELVNIRFLKPKTYKVFLTSAMEDDKLETLIIHKGTLTDDVLNSPNLTLTSSLKRLELREVAGITSQAVKSLLSHAFEGGARSAPLEVVLVGCQHVKASDFDDRFKKPLEGKIVISVQ